MVVGKEFGVNLENYSGSAGESLRQAISFCADNRHRFSDYKDNPSSFDGWIDLLLLLFTPRDRETTLHIVDNLYWGLPPVIVSESR